MERMLFKARSQYNEAASWDAVNFANKEGVAALAPSQLPPELKNKNKALKVLRARLLDMKTQEQEDKRAEERKSQVGTGDRSGRIRTYNFPQNRVTDHRIGLTLYKLDSVMQGSIRELIEGLTAHYQTQALQNAESVAAR